MGIQKKYEVWLRGPLPAVSPLLQPVAHALLQAKEEVNELMQHFPEHLLWQKPASVASPAFHLQHMKGVIDRLLTYARGKALSAEQLQYLEQEGVPNAALNSTEMLNALNTQVNSAIAELENIDDSTLCLPRGVGRAQLPSTVIGLLVHAAEHTQRHAGQLLVTVRILKSTAQPSP